MKNATQPVLRLTDKRFVYTDAANTDIRATLKRFAPAAEVLPVANVQPIKKRKA